MLSPTTAIDFEKPSIPSSSYWPHTSRRPQKKPVSEFIHPVLPERARPDITALLADTFPASSPKSPSDKPLRPYERYVNWCLRLGRRDHVGNRRLARRFLKQMRLGRV